MTLYQWGQVLFAVAACVVIVMRARVLWFVAPLEVKPVLDKVLALTQRGAFDELRALVGRMNEKTWIRVALARAVQAAPKLEAAEAAVDEALIDLKEEAQKGLLPLRVMTSLATTSGLLGAVLELTYGARPDTSLRALEAGLPARIAFSNAMSCMALGIGIAIVTGVSLRVFRRDAVRLYNDARQVADRFCASLQESWGDGA